MNNDIHISYLGKINNKERTGEKEDIYLFHRHGDTGISCCKGGGRTAVDCATSLDYRLPDIHTSAHLRHQQLLSIMIDLCHLTANDTSPFSAAPYLDCIPLPAHRNDSVLSVSLPKRP